MPQTRVRINSDPFRYQLTRPTHPGLIARSLAQTTRFRGIMPGETSQAR